MSDSGNQQATRIGYFVGILEGEGHFHQSDSGSAQVEISNLNLDIITSCESFLRTNNIWFVRDIRFRDGRNEYIIKVSNSSLEVFQYARLLYELISPSMQCRHDQFQSILGASTTPRDLSVDLDWLAGILEAEGSFSLTLDHRRNAALAISMSNTNTRIIDKVECNLDMMGCGFHLRDKVKRLSHHKPARIIAVTGMKRCYTFLSGMEGRWMSKRHKRLTDAIYKFINCRFSHSQRDSYTPRELQLIQTVIDLNT